MQVPWAGRRNFTCDGRLILLPQVQQTIRQAPGRHNLLDATGNKYVRDWIRQEARDPLSERCGMILGTNP